MSQKRTVTIPFVATGPRPSELLAPKEQGLYALQPSANLWVDALHLFGGEPLTVVSLQLPMVEEPITDLVAGPHGRDLRGQLEPHQRLVRTCERVELVLYNDGKEAVRPSPTFQGRFKLSSDGPDWGSLFTLTRQPEKCLDLRLPLHSTFRLPFATELLSVKVTSNAPKGKLFVHAVQLGNVNLLVGDSVPVEAFENGAAMRAPPCDAGTYVTLTLGPGSDGDPKAHEYTVRAEVELLARGQVDPRPPQRELSEEVWPEQVWQRAREFALSHGAEVTLIEQAAKVMGPGQVSRFASLLSEEAKQALTHQLVHGGQN
jgi:hypothetical protein